MRPKHRSYWQWSKITSCGIVCQHSMWHAEGKFFRLHNFLEKQYRSIIYIYIHTHTYICIYTHIYKIDVNLHQPRKTEENNMLSYPHLCYYLASQVLRNAYKYLHFATLSSSSFIILTRQTWRSQCKHTITIHFTQELI